MQSMNRSFAVSAKVSARCIHGIMHGHDFWIVGTYVGQCDPSVPFQEDVGGQYVRDVVDLIRGDLDTHVQHELDSIADPDVCDTCTRSCLEVSESLFTFTFDSSKRLRMAAQQGEFVVIKAVSFHDTEDVDTLCSLVATFAREKYNLQADTERLKQFLPNFANGFAFLVELPNGKETSAPKNFCGYALCIEMMNSFMGGLAVQLHDIYVTEEYRGMKIGQKLMDAVVAEAKSRGCLKLTLNTHELNAGARVFYERNGFECYDGFITRNACIKGRSLHYTKKLS